MFKHSMQAFIASSILGGCAIHPLPEDVTGIDTLDIVKQIRCETRQAAIKLLVDFLEDQGKDYPNSLGNPLARDLAVEYARDPNTISASLVDRFKGFPNTQAVINTLYNVGIAYNFDLQMTEDNNLSTDINFLRPLTQPKFTLGIKAGAARKRNNGRTFTVTDTFLGLLTQLNQRELAGQRYCVGHIVVENYVYPIAGRIGVDKLARDFINLTIFGNLGAGKEDKPDAPGLPAMADELTFTTTINASATPKVEFTPVTSAFQLADASFTGEVIRTDKHQVTVALAIETKGGDSLRSLRDYLSTPEQRASRTPVRVSSTSKSLTYVGNRVIGSGTPSERLALIAIDQLKSRQIQLIAPP
jgi:hypothetical protein